MKPKVLKIIQRIQSAVDELQSYSYNEFRQLLPSSVDSTRSLGYSMLDQVFSGETGITIKDFFNQVKSDRAGELFMHYRLNANEVAYQLGFRNPSSLKKAIRTQNHSRQSIMHFTPSHHRILNAPEFIG